MKNENDAINSQKSDQDMKHDSIVVASSTSSVVKPDVFTQFMKDLANTRNHPYFFEGSE